MADPIETPRTTANPDANTTTTAGTTPHATVSDHTTATTAAHGAGTTTGTATPTPGSHAAHMKTSPADDKSATKGLIIGVLTFVALWVIELLDGATEPHGLISVTEMLIYAVIGLVVGVVVKAIDKSRHKSTVHA